MTNLALTLLQYSNIRVIYKKASCCWDSGSYGVGNFEASLRAQASTRASSSARYDGAVPCKHLYIRTASLNWILLGALSQCSWRRSGVMWLCLDEENTSRAAEFRTDWSWWRRYEGMPARGLWTLLWMN